MSIGHNGYNINTLLSNSVVSTATDVDIEKSCPISLEKYQVGDEFVTLQCSHTFSKGSLYRWLQTNTTCPLCRCNLVPQTSIVNNIRNLEVYIDYIVDYLYIENSMYEDNDNQLQMLRTNINTSSENHPISSINTYDQMVG